MQRCEHNRRLCTKPLLWAQFTRIHLFCRRLWQLRECVNKLCGATRFDEIHYPDRGHCVLPLIVNHMDGHSPADELAGLRKFLARLESGYLRLRRNQVDVTKSEICILKREIAHLERILNYAKPLSHNAPAVRNNGRHRLVRQSFTID